MTHRPAINHQIYTMEKTSKPLWVALAPLQGFIFPTDIFLRA